MRRTSGASEPACETRRKVDTMILSVEGYVAAWNGKREGNVTFSLTSSHFNQLKPSPTRYSITVRQSTKVGGDRANRSVVLDYHAFTAF